MSKISRISWEVTTKAFTVIGTEVKFSLYRDWIFHGNSFQFGFLTPANANAAKNDSIQRTVHPSAKLLKIILQRDICGLTGLTIPAIEWCTTKINTVFANKFEACARSGTKSS